MPRKIICTNDAPQPVGPYSQAIEVPPFLFISGQIPLDAATGAVKGRTIAEQATVSLQNMKNILAAAGLSPSSLVKTTVFLRSMADFALVNTIYEKMLDGAKPARSVVEVSALPKGVLVEIEGSACR